MSRSGYTDDCGNDWAFICWRGAVKSAIKGKRGQAFLREMAAAMDAMPAKRLIAHDLVKDGEVCAIGSVAVARGIDVSDINVVDDEDGETASVIAKRMGIAGAMVQEIEYVNDCDFWCYDRKETPEQRWQRVRKWIEEQIATGDAGQASEPNVKNAIADREEGK